MRRDRRASTTVEFAVVGWMLCMVTFAIIEAGLLWWLKSGMELTASMTARCGAMGYYYNTSNFLCANTGTSPSPTQNYAVNYALGLLGSNGSVPWLLTNMITANNVNVIGPVSGSSSHCRNAPGNYFAVTISSGYFQSLPPPLGNYTSLSVSACYPMP